MKYYVIVNRRVRYMRVYSTIKHVGEQTNALTKLFMKILKVDKKGSGVSVP